VTVLLRRGTARWRIGIFSAGVVLAWFLIAWPAHLLAGNWGLVGSSVSAILCVVPGWITLIVSGHRNGPTAAVFVALRGMVLRLVFVLGVGMGLYLGIDGFTPRSLLVWLVVFYCITLALETALVIGPKSS